MKRHSDAPSRRHHDRVCGRLRLRSPDVVGERHAIESHNLDRNAPSDGGPVDVNEVQANVCVRRSMPRNGETRCGDNIHFHGWCRSSDLCG
jgi:hypothetical protein